MTDACVRCGFPSDQCGCPARAPAGPSINPWTTKPPEVGRPMWEFVAIEKTAEKHPDLYRMRVPGGWLYRLAKSDSLTFVPDR